MRKRVTLFTGTRSCLQKQACDDNSQNSWLCYYCAVLCVQRWIGSEFSATKSLGMHTGAGSGNSNTALSSAAKEYNRSCPIWSGLEHSNHTQIPIFSRERHSLQVIFLKGLFVSFNHPHYLSTASFITIAVAASTHQSTFDHRFHLFIPTIGLCVLFNITFDLLILLPLLSKTRVGKW